jgi:subtilisin family serine protease
MLLSVLIGISGMLSASAGTLTDAETAKLHPFFKQVVAEQAANGGIRLEKTAPVVYEAIVYTSSPEAVRAAGFHVNSAFGDFVTVQVAEEDLERLARVGEVSYIDPGNTNKLCTEVSIPDIGAPLLHGGFINNTPYKGQGAIVLIFDSGIDWNHLDFRNPSAPAQSRILAIWDQTLTASGAETPPTGFTYGVEYTQAHINDELDGSPTGFVRTRDINGHGSHVAGIAAGNGGTLGGKYMGVAPLADIIVVKGGDYSFSESRMIDALTYAQMKSSTFGKPVAVNFSVGGQVGPHDGTRPYEAAMASFTSTAGRMVVAAAGNDGNLNMHRSGTMPASGSRTFTFTVPGYSPASGTDNDGFLLDFWLDGSNTLTATITSPNGVVFTRTAGQTGESPTTTDGTITLWNYLSASNGMRNVYLWVHDKTASTPASGTWTYTITNNTANSMPFDAWLAESTVGAASVSLPDGDNEKSVSQPGTANGILTAASYVTKWGWPSYTGSNRAYSGSDRTSNISTFSGIGPTRDGRQKPDIAAPGQGISSVLSTHTDTTGEYNWIHPGQKHWLMQGTSMATPHVTGAAALLLAIAPTLSVGQISSLLTSTANTDGFTGSTWNAVWGAGKLDIVEAVKRHFVPGATVARTVYSYDTPTTNTTAELTGSTQFALRFTPDVNGRMTGVFINATTLNNVPIVGPGPLRCEVFTNNGGVPGTKMGNTVLHPLQLLSAGTLNYVQMLDAGVTVASGTDYFIVLSQTNATDTLIIRGDLETTGTRSLINAGGGWATAGTNLRIRPIVSSGSGVTGIADAGSIPDAYTLEQNYPNPFNPSTTIHFSIPANEHVILKVFNVLGQEVATLVHDDLAAGRHIVQWQPDGLASGTYLYRLEAGSFRETRKVVYLR